MKKIFGELNITWKKLIIFSILIGIYTGIMAMLPYVNDTSFTITSPDGEEYVYKITIGRSIYERERIK